MSDGNWAAAARGSRDALRLLGWDPPRCLPGEPDACGGSFAQHTISYLAAIKAVADHQLSHLNAPPAMVRELYDGMARELDARRPC